MLTHVHQLVVNIPGLLFGAGQGHLADRLGRTGRPSIMHSGFILRWLPLSANLKSHLKNGNLFFDWTQNVDSDTDNR